MEPSSYFLLIANVTLLLHVLIVMFVVFGLILIFIGKFRQWLWVRHPWFRLIHVLVITVVVFQSWLGFICPLTTIEMTFRAHANVTVYEGSFIAHWLQTILYYQAPPSVFIVGYTVFAIAVIISWFWVKPRSFTK